jgi:CO/xanthine dehydrogenase Mo-binding subunit
MNADGTAYFNYGSTRLQPGACTSVGATIAEILGMTFDKVQVGTFGNTDTAAEGPPQYGSGATTANSFAAMDAALDVKEQLFKEAAEMLEVDPEDLDASEGVIFVKTNPAVSTTHADVMGGISRPIIGRGTKVGLQPSNVIRKPVGDFPIGTPRFHRASTGAGTEVAVDTETGEVEILKHIIVVDAGRIIDGIGAPIQVQSAWEHMIHKSKYWSVKYDPGTGVLLSQTHLDDKIPTSLDVPIDKMEFVILEGIGAAGPWGAHGLGEPPASNLQSVLNAVNNALGTQITQRPWTNIRILKALGKG